MDLSKYKLQFLIETVNMKNISDEEYFSSKYKEYSSNSKLSYINPLQEGSPTKYKEGLKSGFNSSFDLGSAVHALFLQPNDFVLSEYSGKPTAKLGEFIYEFRKARIKGLSLIDASLVASEKADYYKGKLSDKIIKTAIQKGLDYYIQMLHGLYEDEFGRGVIVLNKKQLEDCKACLGSLKGNSLIYQVMFMQNFFDTCKIFNEEALFIDLLITIPDGRDIILPMKLKLDNYKIDPSEKTIYLNDLKTSAKNINYFMGGNIPLFDEIGNKNGEQWIDGSFQKYHYYRQIAFYLIVLQIYCKSLGYEGYTYKANMAVVQTLPEFSSKLHTVSEKYIKLGMEEFKELICRVAFHELNGYDVEFKED